MAKTATAADQLRKGAKVVARTDLRDVPEGTAGKVILVAGLTWIRYWVRFENGIYLGSVDRSVLATADDWKRHLAGEDLDAGAGAAVAADDVEAGGGDGSDGAAGGVTTPSGTLVPQKLIDRAKAARARKAA